MTLDESVQSLTQDLAIKYTYEGEEFQGFVDSSSKKIKNSTTNLIESVALPAMYHLEGSTWWCSNGKGGGFTCPSAPEKIELDYSVLKDSIEMQQYLQVRNEPEIQNLLSGLEDIVYEEETIKDTINGLGVAINKNKSESDILSAFNLDGVEGKLEENNGKEQTMENRVWYTLAVVAISFIYMILLKLARYIKTKETDFKSMSGFAQSIVATDHFNDKIVRSRYIQSAEHLKARTDIDLEKIDYNNPINIPNLVHTSNLYTKNT